MRLALVLAALLAVASPVVGQDAAPPDYGADACLAVDPDPEFYDDAESADAAAALF